MSAHVKIEQIQQGRNQGQWMIGLLNDIEMDPVSLATRERFTSKEAAVSFARRQGWHIPELDGTPPRTIWIAGRQRGYFQPTGAIITPPPLVFWDPLGIYETAQEADRRCKEERDFYAALPLGVDLPDELYSWPSVRFPRLIDALTGRKAAIGDAPPSATAVGPDPGSANEG